MQKPIKIGVIGHLGSIGSRHYKNFKDLGCEVIGCDIGGDPRPLTKCDGVVIASPTPAHFTGIRSFQTAGIPMLVEKPIVGSRWEAEQIPFNHVKMVGYNLRFHSCVKKARGWMELGLIGRPMWARFTCAQFNERPAYIRDGVILNWSHEIDLALFLLGEAAVKAAVSNNPLENLVDIILHHNNNKCQTVIHLDYNTNPERRGFVIVGTGGSIDADLVSRQAFCKDARGGILHNHFGRDSFDGNYISEAKAFLAIIKGEGNNEGVIGCTAEEALRVTDVCFRAKELIGGG